MSRFSRIKLPPILTVLIHAIIAGEQAQEEYMSRFSRIKLTPVMIVLIYAIIGGLWILFSDRLLSSIVTDPRLLVRLSIAKGWLYVLASALLLYWLIRKENETIRRSTEALRKSEERFKRIVDTSQEGIWILDADGRTNYVNVRLAEMFGYSIDEMLNKSVFDFISPPLQEEMRMRLERRSRGLSDKYDFRFRRKDGSDVWVIVSATPLQDENGKYMGSFAMLTDITGRKRVEEALRLSERRYRTLFDFTPAAIFAFNHDAIILQANTACERLYGYSQAQLTGKSMFDTIARTEESGKTLEIISRVFAGESFENLEWQDTRADGSTVYVLTNTAPIYDDSGQVVMGLSLNMDITERKLSEQARAELAAHKREFYRRTILAATEGKLEITERKEIEEIAGPVMETWTISKGEDLGLIRSAAMKIAQREGMDEDRIYDFILCIGEATTNAYKHAGGGTASIHQVRCGLLFMVSDQGHGMEALTLPEVALTRGYTTADSLGMGYKAMISIADKVYLATGPTGTTVAIEMCLHPVEKPIAPTILPDTWRTTTG